MNLYSMSSNTMCIFGSNTMLLAFFLTALVAYAQSDLVTISSDRVVLSEQDTRAMTGLVVDGTDILGPVSGRIGMSYYDCYCIPSVNATVWSPSNPNPQSSRHYYVGQSTQATFQVVNGISDSTPWAGLVMSEIVSAFPLVFSSPRYNKTGQQFQQWWFLRDNETGYHTFTLLAFNNGSDNINLGNIQELRQVISPNTDMYILLPTRDNMGIFLRKLPLPIKHATWHYNVSNPYTEESSDYFTKYEWADLYGDHKAHGFYADGTQSNGSTWGLWQVFNSLEGYTGGPLRSDLVMDTNIYNYYLSNHHGASTLDLTSGFDRVFGPSFVYLNRDADLLALLADAESKADATFAAEFCDDVAGHITSYVPSSGRGTLQANVTLPKGSGAAKAVLTEVGIDFQDATNSSALQYWVNVSDGSVSIPRVVAGTYRLTIHADGIFGQYEQDGVEVFAYSPTLLSIKWSAESHGVELFRLGIPDKTSGEYKQAFAPESNHSLHQEEYRQYWGVWDFPNDFPNSVNFTIGQSDIAENWNDAHYSRYGGTRTRPEYVLDNVNEWTLNWTPGDWIDLKNKTATFTLQLAGVRTPSGNLDAPASEYSDLDYTLKVDNHSLVWTIPYNSSSSCTDRSGIACYNVHHLFTFPGDWLSTSTNVFTLALPYNASGGDINFSKYSVSVVYDALRLELK